MQIVPEPGGHVPEHEQGGGATNPTPGGAAKGTTNAVSPQGYGSTDKRKVTKSRSGRAGQPSRARKGPKAPTRGLPRSKDSAPPRFPALARCRNPGRELWVYLRAYALRRIAARQLFDGSQETAEALTAALVTEATRDGRSRLYPSAYDLHGTSLRGVLTWERMEGVAASAARNALGFHDRRKIEKSRQESRRGGLRSGEVRRENVKAPVAEVARLKAEGFSKAAIAIELNASESTIATRLRQLRVLEEAGRAQSADASGATGPNGATATQEPTRAVPQPPTPKPEPEPEPDLSLGEGGAPLRWEDPLEAWRQEQLREFAATLDW